MQWGIMFKHEFQGGPCVEVFSAQRKDPVNQWKLTGSSTCNKVFDQDVKSYVYSLEGTNVSTRMQLPKDVKLNLALQQRYLVLQVYITKGEDFCLDVGILDSSSTTRRRLILSTANKEFHTTALHTKIPMTLVKKSVWLNLCLDLLNLVCESWKGQVYKSLESICVAGHCKLRRIFTMKTQPFDTTDDHDVYGFPSPNNSAVDTDSIPRQCVLAPDLKHYTQVLTMAQIRFCETKVKPMENQHLTGSELDLSSSSASSTRKHDDYHIAFGKKISGSAPLSRKGSGKEGERKGSGKDERRSAGKDREKEERRTSGKDREKEERRSAEKDREREERRSAGKDREREERRSAGKDREREERRSSGKDKEREDRRSSGKDREREERRSAGKDREKEDRRNSGKDRDRRNVAKDMYNDNADRKMNGNKEMDRQRYHHSRSKSDSEGNSIGHGRVQHEPKLEEVSLDSSSISELQLTVDSDTNKRDRRDSDPGASQNDPDITVDKDSLRSSHTWTDGADGQESIPFVKPHPPSEPSSAKHRRPARVKSAGKERTPHAGHIFYNETKSPPSGSTQSGDILPSPPNGITQHTSNETKQQHKPMMMMANETEIEDIFMAMQRSVTRQLSLEEDKYNTDSDYTSGAHEGETDSISDVIQTLNSKKIDDDITGGEGEYESSEDENDTDKEEAQVYSFSSAPRQAPRMSYRTQNVETEKKTGPLVKNSVKSHRTRVRKRLKSSSVKRETDTDSRKIGGGDAFHHRSGSNKKQVNGSGIVPGGNSVKNKNRTVTKSQDDFFMINGSSDEEDVLLPARQVTPHKKRSPRGKKYIKTVGKTGLMSQYSPNQKLSQSGVGIYSPVRIKMSSDEIDSSTYDMDRHHYPEYLQIPMSAHSPHLPDIDSGSNAMFCSVNRHHLRAMTEKEVKLRKSGGNKHYNPNAYRMGSESMEHSMLLRNMSDGSGDEDNKDGTLVGRHSTLRLDGTDSDDNTETFNTLKPPSEKNDYMDEIGENIFLDDPFKTISDHRVFSPEIVLPSQKHNNGNQHLDEDKQYHHSVTSSNSGYSSAEEELELLYDYILQCYYDPKTGIFYQLK